MSSTSLRTVAACALAVVLGGCVIAPLGSRYDRYSAEEGPIVATAPPAPQYEGTPAAPGPGYVWIGGYWGWNLGRHVWIGGRWALPPAGHAWVPGYWGRHAQGWRWQGGYWGRR